MSQLPPLVDPADVIPSLKLRGKTKRSKYERGMRLLGNVGVLRKVGGRWKVVASKLNRELPDVYDMLCESHA